MALIPSVEEILEKDIFELLGIENASDEQKQELLQTMTTTIEARVVNRVAEMLDDTAAKNFQEIAEAGDADKLVNFLVEQKIDLPQIVSEEATRHRVEVVQLIKLAEQPA